jgi:tetratricopeptide (TPR) repeat protein
MRIALVSFLFVLFIPNLASAELKTFIKEYTYQASDEDSKNSSRTIALREVKRLLLEELGTYLESVTEVKDFKLTKDQIATLTAGIVKTEIVEEKWDGRTYWLKSKIAADSGEVIKAIAGLRKDRVKTKELEEVRKRSDELLRENERLRKELTVAKGHMKQKKEAAYNKTIKELTSVDWFEKGYASETAGNHNDAIDAFSKAIELNPRYAKAYSKRGLAYNMVDNPELAVEDFNRAIKLNPKDAGTYNNRGNVYTY